jgi:hypothetical protein
VGERQWPVKTKMLEFTGIASCCPTGLSSYWLMCLHRDSTWHPVTGHLNWPANWHRVNGTLHSVCVWMLVASRPSRDGNANVIYTVAMGRISRPPVTHNSANMLPKDTRLLLGFCGLDLGAVNSEEFLPVLCSLEHNVCDLTH